MPIRESDFRAGEKTSPRVVAKEEMPYGVVPAPIVIGEMSTQLHDYRLRLTDEIQASEERLKYLMDQKRELDNFLSGDVLKAWARERGDEVEEMMDEGPGKFSRHG